MGFTLWRRNILESPRPSGPVEIAGGDRRLTFDGVDEAAEKIARVIQDPALERELVSQVAERRDWFSTERFCESVREIAAQFVREAAERKTELRGAGTVAYSTGGKSW
jgi:hypothetical protein